MIVRPFRPIKLDEGGRYASEAHPRLAQAMNVISTLSVVSPVALLLYIYRIITDIAPRHRILSISSGIVGFVAAALTIYSFFWPGGSNELPPAEYAGKLNLIACDFEEASREGADDVEGARKAFESEPLEYLRPYVGEIWRFSVGDLGRVGQAIEDLANLAEDGVPEKFRADHENYVAALTAYQRNMREVVKGVPDNALELSYAELVREVVPHLEEITRNSDAARAALSQAHYGREFEVIKSCPDRSRLPPLAPTSTQDR